MLVDCQGSQNEPLNDLNIDGLRSFIAWFRVELDIVTFLDFFSLNIADVEEDVLIAIVWLDETVLLAVVEKVHIASNRKHLRYVMCVRGGGIYKTGVWFGTDMSTIPFSGPVRK